MTVLHEQAIINSFDYNKLMATKEYMYRKWDAEQYGFAILGNVLVVRSRRRVGNERLNKMYAHAEAFMAGWNVAMAVEAQRVKN